jgi:hypothetical protein
MRREKEVWAQGHFCDHIKVPHWKREEIPAVMESSFLGSDIDQTNSGWTWGSFLFRAPIHVCFHNEGYQFLLSWRTSGEAGSYYNNNPDTWSQFRLKITLQETLLASFWNKDTEFYSIFTRAPQLVATARASTHSSWWQDPLSPLCSLSMGWIRIFREIITWGNNHSAREEWVVFKWEINLFDIIFVKTTKRKNITSK